MDGTTSLTKKELLLSTPSCLTREKFVPTGKKSTDWESRTGNHLLIQFLLTDIQVPMSSTDIIARKDWTEKGGTELQMNEVVLGGNERNKSADGLPRTKKMNHSVSTSTRCLFNLWNRRIRDPMSRPPTKSAPK